MTTAGKGRDIAPADGKLGVLLPGMGAVATTFIAGVEAVRRGLAKPIGSLTQMGTVRLGKRTEGRSPLIKDFVPLAGLDQILFGGWDVFPDSAYEAAKKAGVLERGDLEPIKGVPRRHQALAGRLRPAVRQEAERPERQEGQVQARPGRAGLGRHRPVQEGEGARPAGHGLVRLDRGVPRGGRGPLLDREVREGPRREPPRHPALDDLRLLRDQGGDPLLQRRAEPLRRLPGDGGPREEDRHPDRRQGLQDRPDPDEDDPRPGLQGAPARA